MARQGDLEVVLGPELPRALEAFERALNQWAVDVEKRLKRLFARAGERWKRGAKRRVPVGPSRKTAHGTVVGGTLRNSIQSNVFTSFGLIGVEVGTNVREYPEYVEFGTRYIAGGRVKALGLNPEITDAQAITTWPAKEESGAQREQMPWLRPAWASDTRDWMLNEINEALRPPMQGAV